MPSPSGKASRSAFMADLARVQAAQGDAVQAHATLGEALALEGMAEPWGGGGVHCPGHAELGEAARGYRLPGGLGGWLAYAFYNELRRIRAALSTMRLPRPMLPTRTPSQLPPLPDEASIRAFVDELIKGRGASYDSKTPPGAVALTTPTTTRPWWQSRARKS